MLGGLEIIGILVVFVLLGLLGMAKKDKEEITRTQIRKAQQIILLIVGALAIFVLILIARILLNIQDYFP